LKPRSPRRAWTTDTTAANGLTWSFFEGGVVIDVAATLAFPDNRRDLSGWNALLRLIKRYRPRRPIDGVIVAVPATLLVDDAWKGRVQTMSAAIRERLRSRRRRSGSRCRLRRHHAGGSDQGFSAFTSALPTTCSRTCSAGRTRTRRIWCSRSSWIAEGILELHRGIVHMQVELFAGRPHIEQASDFFLFSGEVKRISEPLRILLEEDLPADRVPGWFSCRGFYLCGQATAATTPSISAGGWRRRRSSFSAICCRARFSPSAAWQRRCPHSVARDRVSVAAQVAAC
jgi:type VI secretion system protein ImpL